MSIQFLLNVSDFTPIQRQHQARLGHGWPDGANKSLLPRRRPGPPSIESVTRAIRLQRILKRKHPDEKPEQLWARIYPRAIPNWEALSKDDRIAQKLLLRNRVWSRRNQRRRRGSGRKAA